MLRLPSSFSLTAALFVALAALQPPQVVGAEEKAISAEDVASSRFSASQRSWAFPEPQWVNDQIIIAVQRQGHEGEIVRVSPTGGPVRALTSGTFPRISPDQKTLAFIRGDLLHNVSWEKAQLFTMSLSDPRRIIQVTHDRDGLGSSFWRQIAWSPDSRSIAVGNAPGRETWESTFRTSRAAQTDAKPTVEIEGVPGPGTVTFDFETVIRVFDVQTMSSRTVFDRAVVLLTSLGWVPRSKALLYNISTLSRDAAQHVNFRTMIDKLDLGTLRETVLLERQLGGQGESAPLANRDGKEILFAADAWHRILPDRRDLAVLDVNGHIGYPAVTGPVNDAVWGPDGRTIFGVAGTAMARRVFSIVPGSTVHFLSHADGLDYNPIPSHDGRWLAWIHQDLYGKATLRVENIAKGSSRDLLTISEPLRGLRVATVRRVTWIAPGNLRLAGLLFTPPSFDRSKRYPMIVSVHGGEGNGLGLEGPAVMGSIGEFHYMASLGYVIFAPDYRTSDMYGPKVVDEVRRNRSRYLVVARDITSGADEICKTEGYVDCSRLAIVGQSWGGAYTSFLLTVDHRFKAAVISEGIGDSWENAGGDASENLEAFFLGPPRTSTASYNRNSAVYNAARITTPTLFMQAEHGVNSIADQYIFHLMQARHIDSERLFYRGDAHALERPANRLDFLQRIRAWLSKYVPAGPSSA